jgi:hypothetical protein
LHPKSKLIHQHLLSSKGSYKAPYSRMPAMPTDWPHNMQALTA